MIKRIITLSFIFLLGFCLYNFLIGYSTKSVRHQIEAQIQYIACSLSQGDDIKLDEKYPEGYLFSNAIFALSITEYSAEHPKVHYQDYVEASLDKLLSDFAKSKHDSLLAMSYGCFYNGWTNLALKSYLESELSVGSTKRGYYQDCHAAISLRISEAYDSNPSFHESYTNGIWPADNLACLASLNKIKAQSIFETIWQEDQLKLVPHELSDLNKVRGSSSALSLYFLSRFMDEEFIKDYNTSFIDKFGNQYLGLNFIDEFGDDNEEMDYDSGPIIFGIGSVATIMNVKTQSNIKSSHFGKSTWMFLNMIGCPLITNQQKFYLAKQELMFDVFMLWLAVSFSY